MDRNLLIVDDDRHIVAMLASLLEDAGFVVRKAYDGRSALQEAELSPPDLVLSDIAMPKLNGLALAQRLRDRGIPVVLLSAAVSNPQLTGIPFVAKPFDLDQILEVVARCLGRPRATEPA
ncbi:MAG: response regulator [Solirubrobacterales bacterium]|nr:response regulator [Solirubrobacterales bacterium]